MKAKTIFLAGAALMLLSQQGRRKHPGMEALKKWRYAHRGLHDAEKPENSMAAFRAALEGGYGIELDVHLLKDGSLAVLHDSDLKRVTGREGILEDLTADELAQYPLMGTDQTIPLFSQVLALFDGKAPLIVELKTHNGNHAALADAVCSMLEDYRGAYCLESFDPLAVHWLRINRPELIRGQLSENFIESDRTHSLPGRVIVTCLLENFLTKPDFVAYKYEDRLNPWVFACRRLWGLTGVSWTLKTREQYDQAIREGWIPIFEGFDPNRENNA